MQESDWKGDFETLPRLRSSADIRFAFLVVLAGLLIGIHYHIGLWTLLDNGFSEMSERLPYWDFTNLWAGGLMARQGHADWLFDVEQYRSALRSMFSPDLPNQEWSYPPSILLIGVPLSYLPIGWAYIVWILGSLIALAFALQCLKLDWRLLLVALLSPAAFMSALFGQNGIVTAALLIGCFHFADRRPILSGILAGLLTVKPQLGILIPFVYIASGNLRGFLSASVTTILLVLISGSIFGFAIWQGFFLETRPLMSMIMEAPYPQLYHANALTFFIMARSLGLDLFWSYTFQALISLVAILAVWRLWSINPRDNLARQSRIVFTALLALLATPYGYTYDAVPFSIAVAWWFLIGRSPNRILFCLLWLFPEFTHLANYFGIGLGILFPAGLALYAWHDMRKETPVLQLA
ncbi:glycosyltransferase family 87 protein [Rhizobium alvei]|uniref:Glycosyltransferase family 87 protein n=1 Tax=Rhizobium alvei TaxID=1132659 RepID=A0ABT8YN50_9HYPH|nr:glycosyltransferase family 87 protein [Rhizobium alvei]MDO6964687.1 glycosyltransferase family 87 protein [Rhizobium alvei]